MPILNIISLKIKKLLLSKNNITIFLGGFMKKLLSLIMSIPGFCLAINFFAIFFMFCLGFSDYSFPLAEKIIYFFEGKVSHENIVTVMFILSLITTLLLLIFLSIIEKTFFIRGDSSRTLISLSGDGKINGIKEATWDSSYKQLLWKDKKNLEFKECIGEKFSRQKKYILCSEITTTVNHKNWGETKICVPIDFQITIKDKLEKGDWNIIAEEIISSSDNNPVSFNTIFRKKIDQLVLDSAKKTEELIMQFYKNDLSPKEVCEKIKQILNKPFFADSFVVKFELAVGSICLVINN